MLERRFRELLNVHEKCWNLRLENYRLMSLIIGHLLRHTFVTPRIKHQEVRNALEDTRFSQIVARFGLFFLHGLNLTTMRIRVLPEADPTGLIKAYKIPFKTKTKAIRPLPLSLLRTKKSIRYPWGTKLSQSMIKDLLLSIPDEFLMKPCSSEVLSLKISESNKIFRVFTSEIWTLLSPHYVTPPAIPGTLAEAISLWSLKNIRGSICIGDIFLHATYDGLELPAGKKLKDTERFSGRRHIFFPEKTAGMRSPCTVFLEHATQYLSMYHYFHDTHTEEESQQLDEDLDGIFALLQCLPASTVTSKMDVVWNIKRGEIEFVVNGRYLPCQAVQFERAARIPRAKLNRETVIKNHFEKM